MAHIPLNEVFFQDTAPPSFARRRETFIYKPGTTEQLTVYRSEEGSETYSQPLETDHTGRPRAEGNVPWLATANYDVVIGTTRTAFRAISGGGGSEPTGPAGGDLTGTYPNPTIGAGKVVEADLGAEAVSEGKIKALAVATGKLAANAVTAAKVGAEAIETAGIKALAVTEAKIAAGAVVAAKLGAESVETAKIKLLAVTEATIAAEAVGEAKIKALAVTAGKLGAESVETGKVKLLAITEGLLAAEAVGEAKIKALAVSSGKIAALAVTEGKIAAEAVAEGKITNLAVTAAKLAANAVETAKIKAEAVTEEKLASAVVTKLKGATIHERGFSVPGKTEAVTYRGFYAQIASGETKKLVGMEYSLGSGTKAKFSIKQNGTAVTGFKELEAKSTEALEVSGKTVAIAAKDRFDLTVESIEGEPKDLIVTLWLESTH